MATCGLFFWLGGGPVAEFFTMDPEVVAVARRLLLLAALFQVLEAVYSMYRAALRSAKDVRMGMVIGIVVMWVFVPTSAYFLGKQMGLGAVGGWLGFIGETLVGSLLLWRRWYHGAWRKDYAPRT
jgi:MATE family multidrug resistance protein